MEVIAGRGLYQIYPGGVLANEDVNLSVEKGEIHALVGENGAGKSTLMKMLYGEIAPTKGKILVKGEEVEFHSSKEAMEKGIGMVHPVSYTHLSPEIKSRLRWERYEGRRPLAPFFAVHEA